jgi:hypothetical protein
VITDSFDQLNSAMWGCEYACPTVSDGYARFTLDPGEVNTNTTWSKLFYKNKEFGHGTYAMKFRYNRRPLECEVWAGWALYAETDAGLVNEINFGIETACKSRCTDSTLIMESYRNSKNNEVVVPVGVSLFDGVWHTVELIYSADSIAMNFDGRHVASITDETTFPATTMELIPGARVVSGTLDSRFYLDVDSISFSDSIPSETRAIQHRPVKINVEQSKDMQISVYDVAGKELGTFAANDMKAGNGDFGIPGFVRGTGVYIVRVKSGNSVSSSRVMNFSR